MSDFEDEEGVDEPVLDDENEEEGTEEEEVIMSQNISSYFLSLLCLPKCQWVKTTLHRSNWKVFSNPLTFWRALDRLFLWLQKPPENPLTEEMLADSLSLMCKTGDGLAHAYVRLDVHEK